MQVGSHYLGNGRCRFTVWAPFARQAALHLVSPDDQLLPMNQGELGYFQLEADTIQPGTSYFLQLDGQADRPDPASRFQPEGVHGPSQVVNHSAYQWRNTTWTGIDLQQWIIYELHIGTFTPEGTFHSAVSRLGYLQELGITAVEIMPVSQFPGNRNWGYDGVYPYSVQNSYGTPDDFKYFVDECHARGIAVVLDIVYNHMGPEGNYLREFGPYFIEKYKTPWGDALNYDEEYADGVRDFFSDSAVYWLEHYRLDGLRLDAIHAVFDMGAKHFWQLVNEKVQSLSQRTGWQRYTIAESDLNDVKVITPLEKGGYGFDMQWMDDLHHVLHARLTGERDGYYSDYGSLEQLAKSLRNGYIYDGVYSEYRKRKFGNASAGFSGEHFVVCIQNHDQIGNRFLGDRISTTISFEKLKLAAAAMLLSPYIPMLFMGEEYAEDAPFQYFISHTNKALVEAVREGRKREFSKFAWEGEASDPQSEETFRACQLQWQKTQSGKHKMMLNWYQKLIQLRQTHPALQSLDKETVRVETFGETGIRMLRQNGNDQLMVLMNFGEKPVDLDLPDGDWQVILDSSEKQWQEDEVYVAGLRGRTIPAAGVVVFDRRA